MLDIISKYCTHITRYVFMVTLLVAYLQSSKDGLNWKPILAISIPNRRALGM